MSGLTKSISAAAAAGLLGVAAQAHAATVLKSGDTVDGWKITFPVGISLVSDGGPSLDLEKFAAFDSLEGLDITFTQVAYGASPTITLADEAITNVSGTAFNGFQFLLGNTLQGNGSAPTFGSSFVLNSGNAADTKFTSQTVTPNTIDFSGTLADTDTSDLGFGAAGGDLVIDASPASSGLKKVIDFKEIPGGGSPVVAAPAASWMGLVGLAGVGLIAYGKKIRKALA